MENNKEDFVDYELAIMLENLGFDWGTAYYYEVYSKEHQIYYNNTLINHNCFSDEASAPTLYLAQKWLREIEFFHINIFIEYKNNGFIWVSEIYDIFEPRKVINTIKNDMYGYEDSLIKALKWTCKYLLKQKQSWKIKYQ